MPDLIEQPAVSGGHGWLLNGIHLLLPLLLLLLLLLLGPTKEGGPRIKSG
jgi:hypothetical protein